MKVSLNFSSIFISSLPSVAPFSNFPDIALCIVIVSAVIGDVRGKGLMLGVEFVTDRKLKTPANAETLHIMDQMKGLIHIPPFAICLNLVYVLATNSLTVLTEMGILVGKGGFYGNVFRITPPLCFTKEDAGKIYSSHHNSNILCQIPS